MSNDSFKSWRRKKMLALLIAGSVAGLSSACGTADNAGNGDGGDASKTDPIAEAVSEGEVGITEAEVVAIMNETERLDSELYNAEERIIHQCMEDKGYTAHDTVLGEAAQPENIEEITVHSELEEFIPTREVAEKFGWSVWSWQPELADLPLAAELEAHYEEEFGEGYDEPQGIGEPNPEFENQTQAEFDAYYSDKVGAEYYNHNQSMKGPDAGDSDTVEQPPYGGCTGEMIAAVYGEEALASTGSTGDASAGEDGEEAGHYRPIAYPNSNWEDEAVFVAESSATALHEFESCLSEKGHPGWEVHEEVGIRPDFFWGSAYSGEASESPEGHPAVPADLPTDPDELMELEIQMAVDFVDCNEESALTQTQKDAAKQYLLGTYEASETEIFAAQGKLQDALLAAQDILEA